MTTYVVLSWIDLSRPGYHDGISATREYGSASTKQAAINLAERTLPPGAEYIVTTIHRTVHHGHTPPPMATRPSRGRSR